MAQKGEITRQRILDATATLMQAQGYHATGLNEIIKQSGAPKGSLYFHFPAGKESIAIAAMEQSGRQLTEMLRQLLAISESLGQTVDTLWQFFMTALEASDFRKGCPIATLTLEAAADNPGIQACSAAIYQGWQDLLGEHLQQAGWKPKEAAQRASGILSLLEGALVLAKAQRSVLPLEQTRSIAKALI